MDSLNGKCWQAEYEAMSKGKLEIQVLSSGRVRVSCQISVILIELTVEAIGTHELTQVYKRD